MSNQRHGRLFRPVGAGFIKYQHRVLGMLSLLSVITYLDRVCIAVAGPRIQDDLQIGPEAWGWVTSVFFLSYSAFEIPTGALGDRIGPRRVLTRVVTWWSAFTALTGTVSSYYLLLLVRFCFGAGEAGAYPNASAVIARWIPAAQRTRAWGIVWLTAQVGAAFSPLLVVPIQVRYGWRTPFFVFGIVGVIWSVVWYAWFRDSPHEKRGVDEAELREIGSAPGLHHHRMPWATALRMPAFWRIAAIGACYVYSLGFFQLWLQTYLVKGRGFTEAALVLSSLTYVLGATANGLGGFAGDWMVRRFGLRNGRRWLGVAGLSAAALSMAAAIIAPSGNLALVFLSCAYGGILFQQPTLCALCNDVGRRNAGAVFGFMNTASNVASALSAVIFGYLAGHFGNYNMPFIPMVVLLAIGALLWLQIPRASCCQTSDWMKPGRPPYDAEHSIGERVMTKLISGVIVVAVVAAVASLRVEAQQNQMSFFITSAGPGNGANLGGLAGADKHCQTLAAAAGAGNRTWRAYLSAAAAAGQPAVNARDRIGKGPWMNAKGVVVAKSVADLHSDANNLGGEISLTEKGAQVPGNQHDILTGSQADGTLQTGDAPCGNWTSAEASGGAMVGHHNKQGGGAAPNSWNSAHSSKGCSQQNLIATGGNGYFYCFAN